MSIADNSININLLCAPNMSHSNNTKDKTLAPKSKNLQNLKICMLRSAFFMLVSLFGFIGFRNIFLYINNISNKNFKNNKKQLRRELFFVLISKVIMSANV